MKTRISASFQLPLVQDQAACLSATINLAEHSVNPSDE
jgi:hypothetical protein